MKLTFIAAVSALSTLASGLALPELARRGAVIHPEINISITQYAPNEAWPPISTAQVSRQNGANEFRALLGFVVPACTGTCTISFPTAATTATGSAQLQFFTTIGYPVYGHTWNSKPSTNVHLGTFQVSTTGPGTVLANYGLTFACPATTTKYGYEVQPVGDNDNVTWNFATAGFIITCG